MSSSAMTRGHSIDRASKTVICFGLFAIQIKGAVFSPLPTDLFPADRAATVWGVFDGLGSLGGSLHGLLAGFMIQEAGHESVFLLIASLYLISALLLQIFVSKIASVTY